MASEPGPRPSGRPRDPRKDEAVLAATRELLAKVGYQRTTIAAVARRAGVGAPTIYRRWPRREALIEDAAFGHVQPVELPAPTGDLHTDLRAWVEMFLIQLADPVTRSAVPGLLLAWQQDKGLYQQFLMRNERDVREVLTKRLEAEGVATHAEAVFDFLVNTTMIRAVALGMADAAGYCDRTADALVALLFSSRPAGT